MLYRRIATAAHMTSLRTMRGRHARPLWLQRTIMQTVRMYADKVVKVPQMAESISEGTLKQFSKSVGDFVEQDEEIATIETDKVRQLRHGLCRGGIETGTNRTLRLHIDRCCRQRPGLWNYKRVFCKRRRHSHCRSGPGSYRARWPTVARHN